MTRDNDPRLTGAVVPLILKDEEGNEVEYAARPLTDRDMDEIDAWLRLQFVQRIEQSMEGLKRPEVISAAASQMIGTVPSISFMDGGIGSKMAATPAGLARMVWQSIKADHPKVPYSRIRQLLLVEANRKTSKQHWGDVNLGGNKKASGEGESQQDED